MTMLIFFLSFLVIYCLRYTCNTWLYLTSLCVYPQSKLDNIATLIPNYTGAESIHASMRKCITQKKVGLIEAYVMDQNRAVGQIPTYTAYTEGCNRGKGPAILELAYQNADTIGYSQAFLAASNLALSSSMKYNFHRTEPLHGDL